MRSKTIKRAGFLVALAADAALLLGFVAPASAAPTWRIDAASNPSAAPSSQVTYGVQITNAGDTALPQELAGNSGNCVPGAPGAAPDNCYTITATFPAGLTPISGEGAFAEACTVSTDSIVCSVSGSEPLQQIPAKFGVSSNQLLTFVAEVDPGASGTLTSTFQVSGAGAPTESTVEATLIDLAEPQFGIAKFDGQTTADETGAPFAQAGGHPYDLTTSIEFNSITHPDFLKGLMWPVEPTKDLVVDLPPGLLANLTAVESCTAGELANAGGAGEQSVLSLCPTGSQVGATYLRINYFFEEVVMGPVPVFNMVPPPGSPARFGFNFLNTMVLLDVKLRSHSDYGPSVFARNISQGLPVQGSSLTLWGVPGAASHDSERACPGVPQPWRGGPTCPSELVGKALLRLPTACTAPGEGLEWRMSADSWLNPGDFDPNGNPDLRDPAWDTASFTTHEAPAYPAAPEDWGPARGTEGCADVPVKGTLKAQPTSIDAETSSGLNVHVEVPNPGLENPTGIASSDIKKVKVTLPQGVTINPSQAEGLGVCSPSQYESTELSFHPTPGTGCPDDSKIGTVEVKTPLLEETIPGDVFIARQDDPTTSAPGAENPFDSLLAIYIVLREPQRGILVKLPGEVETDETTGRIVTTFDDLPQQPFSSFDFKFREGARAPLVTPPTCGTYETEAEFTGFSSVDPVTGKVDPADILHTTSEFEIVRGIGGGPCPPGGVRPFKPGFSAGSINNNAGSYSPFVMRLTRQDGEQDLTKFSSILPPGVLAKIAGVERCPEAAIAAAKAKTGRAELAVPSCPANSQIGRSLAGAGVGSVLTYVPGKLYLAGPFGGAPLSVVAITPAVAGPFDVGTVVVREALTLDPVTAEVHVDGERSDPIPHILEGIPLKLRDLRVYVDRDKFTLNPTSCDPSQVRATLFGSFLDVFSAVDDRPVELASRYQASNCASLGFKPKLSLNLKGGTGRGAHPALRAVFKPRPGDANLARTVVKLPRSAFLDQAHIRTICTRVQFAADQCPKGAVYGRVTAFSPLLDEPLKGPAYLRSSNNQLPDLVFDLHGIVDIETSARIDSVRGGIRATFPSVPDAPLSRVVVEMQGGKKGLIVNSRNLCAAPSRADVKLDGHNGKARDFRPRVRAKCGKGRKRKR